MDHGLCDMHGWINRDAPAFGEPMHKDVFIDNVGFSNITASDVGQDTHQQRRLGVAPPSHYGVYASARAVPPRQMLGGPR